LGVEDLAPIRESDTVDVGHGSSATLTDDFHSTVMFAGETAVTYREIGGRGGDDIIIAIHAVDDPSNFGNPDIDAMLD
jgi:hypothetical protein